MSHYKHLSIEEREKLYLLRGQGKSLRTIGRELGRSASTISREMKRGRCWRHPYLPHRAQLRYEKRRKNCGPKRILSNPKYKEMIRSFIEYRQWSPEQISNRLKMEGNALQLSWITIYRAINAGQFDLPNRSNGHKRKEDYFSYKLRRKGKKRKENGTERRQGRFLIEHTIDERPEEANLRLANGHFEADTVAGKKGSELLITLVDRSSRYTLATKAVNSEAGTIRDKIIEMLTSLPADTVKSVTPDRGHEFAKYREITEELPYVKFYFPPPYSPWARGTNENTNGLIREYLPKHKDMADISHEAIQNFISALNIRPRKCLGWKTPFEVFFDSVLHLT